MNKIEINSENLNAALNYLKAMRNLRQFVKVLPKWQRESLSIAPVYYEMPDELDEIERQTNKYINAHIKDYMHKDMYLCGHMRYGATIITDGKIYMHVINIHNKNLIVNQVSIGKGEYGYKSIEANAAIYKNDLEHASINARWVVEAIIDGTLKEIEKDEFDEAVSFYKEMSDKLAKLAL